MSWLDSSFSFAKTALSQAQKSIDRVLDIKEGGEGGQSEPAKPSAASSKPNSTATDADKSGSSEVGPSSASSFSSWFQPKQAQPEPKPDAPTTPSAPTQQSSDSFSSTWGGGNSFWSSTFGSPQKKEQPKSPDATSSLKKPSRTSTAPAASRGSSGRSAKPTSGGPVKNAALTPGSATRGESADLTTGTPRSQTDRRKKESLPTKVESPILTSTPVNVKEMKHGSQKKGESEKQTTVRGQVLKDATDAKKPDVGSRTPGDVYTSQRPRGTAQRSGRGAKSSNRSTPRSENISPRQPPREIPVAAVLEADAADTTDGGGRTQTSGTGGHTSPPLPHSVLVDATPGKHEGGTLAPTTPPARGLATGGVLHSPEEPRGHTHVGGALEYVTLAVGHSPDATGRLISPDTENFIAREDVTEEACIASDHTEERSSELETLSATKPVLDQASKAVLEKEGTPEERKVGSEQMVASPEPRNDQMEAVALTSPRSLKDSSLVPATASENVTSAPTSPPAPITPSPSSGPITPSPSSGPITPSPSSGPITPSPSSGPITPSPPPAPTSPTPPPAPISPTPPPATITPTPPPAPTSPTPLPATISPPTPPLGPTSPAHPPTPAQQSGPLLSARTRDSPGPEDRLPAKESTQKTLQAEPLLQGGAELKSGGLNEADEEPSGSSGAPAPAATGRDPVESTAQEEKLKEELQRVSKILEVRENKLLEMSRDSIQLREENQTLETQLREARELLQSEQTDLEELRSECTRRISVSEKKLQTVLRERDSLRKQLQAVQNEQSQHKRSAEQELTELLKEKEEQIAGLMKEGENLSKQQLQSHNTIKKMRAKDKQNDQLLAAQRQQIEDCELEMRRLKGILEKKEENEKKYQESLAQLNRIAEQQDKELLTLKSERDDMTDKVRSLQTNLDNTFKELAEVRKASAVTQSEAEEAALSAEQMAREELMSVLEQGKMEAQREKESLLMQINELRMSVSRTEQQAVWREEHMRQEVADIQQRLQDAEGRNQELTSSISQTTKPLLRQIDNLQVAHSTQAANWERVEGSLTQRLVEAQTQLNLALEKERSASEKEATLQSRVTALENQLAALRQERAQLLASLELERAKLETLEEGQQRDSAKMEALRTSYQQSLQDLKKEKEMLERQLEYERVRLEAESRKACLESQEKERLRSKLANSLSSLSRTVSRQSSSGSVQSQSEILEKSLVADGGSSGGGLTEGFTHGRVPSASASVIEHLQSQLKQKEGELANTQNLVSSLERSRAAMAEDLASLSAQNETLTTQVETIPSIQQKLQEVQRNYEALLQMYGEKAELNEELKMDIEDLKSMYRQQIDELLNGRR